MKLRMLAALAGALALSGCATTYDYVGGSYDGGYYTGAPVTQYRYYESTYPYYGYSPGVSLGVRYGYPAYGRYPYVGRPGYGYPVYYGGPYRPPVRPGHHGRPDGHRPPPPQDKPEQDRPRDRAPWRDLDRLRRVEAQHPQRPGPRPNIQAEPGDRQFHGRPGGGSRPEGMRPAPSQQRPMPSREFRPRPASGYTPPRSAPANVPRPAATPAPRAAAVPRVRAASPAPAPGRSERMPRTGTRRTLER